jgi:type VII secretion integral membrane protein EccD
MSMRRISIHTEVAGELRAHDVAVCALSPVAVLIPMLVDTVGAELQGEPWQLVDAAGAALDESMSLADNGVTDGDVIVLASAYDPPRGLLAVGPVRTLAAVEERTIAAGVLIEYGWAWMMLAAAVAGICAGSLEAAAALATGAAITSWRAVTSRSVVLAVAGALAAGAAGAALVPGGPAAPNALLGAAVVVAMAVTLVRLHRGAATALTATGSAAAVVAAASTLTGVTAGAVLAVGGVGLLALAPRCAALLAGVRPDHLVAPPPDLAQRADSAHATLTGVVVGAGVATTIGVAVVARAAPSWQAIALAAVTATLLLVRTRTHVGTVRRVALTAAGLGCATAGLVAATVAFPSAAPWVAVGVVTAAALVAVAPAGLTTQRVLDGLDYLSAALVVPTACWALDLYTAARNWVFT